MKQRRLANPLYGIYLLCAIAALVVVYLWFAPASESGRAPAHSGDLAIIPPKAVPTPPASLRSPQGVGRVRVGIVAGHSGFDSGAVCPDGLTEASINLAIAERVIAQLTAKGIPAHLMEEYDPRLEGYVASALVSIHADSCIYPEATGFKVASLEGSSNPQNRLLVDCLITSYGEATALPYHANSITFDMQYYHAFDSISAETPGAIIEVGFMLTDRELLTKQPDQVASGIIDGIECFLLVRRERR